MANIYTLEEYVSLLNQLVETMKIGVDRIEDAILFEEFLFLELSASPSQYVTKMAGPLVGLNALFIANTDLFLAALAESIDIWAVRVAKRYVHNPRTWTNLAVDVDDGSGGSTLDITQTTDQDIFDVFDAGDVVEITEAENPDHNGLYTVAVAARRPTDTFITFTSTMLGSDNPNDETMIITLKER